MREIIITICIFILATCLYGCGSEKKTELVQNTATEGDADVNDLEYIIDNSDVINGIVDRFYHASIDELVEHIKMNKHDSLIEGKVISTTFYYGWEVEHITGYTLYEIKVEDVDNECNYLDIKPGNIIYIFDSDVFLGIKNRDERLKYFGDEMNQSITDEKQLWTFFDHKYYELVPSRKTDYIMYVGDYSTLLQNGKTYYMDLNRRELSLDEPNPVPMYVIEYLYPEEGDVYEMYEKYNALPPEKEGIATAKGIMERIEKQ